MNYSLFTHGTALQIEISDNSANVWEFTKYGWGTQIRLAPPERKMKKDVPFIDNAGPGTWFHLPLTSTTTFESVAPTLDSVTLVFEAQYCRIANVHVYDGFDKIADFTEGTSIPNLPAAIAPGTLELPQPYKVRHGIGLSFQALWRDVDVKPADPNFPFPESILIFGAAGANFHIFHSELSDRISDIIRSVSSGSPFGP